MPPQAPLFDLAPYAQQAGTQFLGYFNAILPSIVNYVMMPVIGFYVCWRLLKAFSKG